MAQAKRLRPIDEAVRIRLAEAAAESSLGQSQIGQLSGMSQNRVGIILRGETPPATVGEIYAMSDALGLDPVEVIRDAEDAVSAASRLDESDKLPDFSQLAARTVSLRPSWDASHAGDDAGEEPQE